MANIKISEMEEASQVISDDYIPIVQQGINKKTKIGLIKTEILKIVFPIGQTYITQTDINPSIILGFGTWERVKGKVLVGLDENDEAFNTIGKTGGAKEVKLVPENYYHNVWSASQQYENNDLTGNWLPSGDKYGYGLSYTSNRNKPHNNLQPYQVTGYMWIRTA